MDFINIPQSERLNFMVRWLNFLVESLNIGRHTVPKAIDAMKNLLPGFERYLLEAHKRGLTFFYLRRKTEYRAKMNWN
ncbi:hypothetical protein P5G70_08290 [Serratia nevei]|nr:hypothetical protein [Serratia nevei]